MNLTLSFIETCSVAELYKIAKNFKVVATNAWDLRQKLIIEFMRKEGSILDSSWCTEKVKKEKEDTLKEDEKRRNMLTEFLDKIITIYNTIKSLQKIKEPLKGEIKVIERDDPLIAFINHEMPDLDEDFHKMTEILKKKPNCSLVVCGVSGAGKSSFINLLVGESLLPTSIRSNSSCQVRLTYGDPERAEIIDLDSNVHTIDKNQFSENLDKYLENIKDRGTMSCKSATIYLKSLILEGGLDIYDTIGLGETEMFNNVVEKDLKEITGILFLLKKNTPLGDKAIGGLSEIIHQLIFNGVPGGSMNFIINMCDLLQNAKEKEDLKRNIVEQLRDKCAFNNPEVTTFSAKQELDFQRNNVMTTNYKDIMKLIQQLHINSINTNTSKVFSFLSKFVLGTIGQIKELEKYAASAKCQRKEYIIRLRTLENERLFINQTFRKKNESYILKEKLLCRKKIDEHFKKMEVQTLVINEIVKKQNCLYGMTDIKEIIREIEQLTEEEILQTFKKFIENEKLLKKCCNEMLTLFIKEFVEYQKKKDEINMEMNRHIDNVMNFIDGDISKIDLEDITWFEDQNKQFMQLMSPILTPIVKLKYFIKVGFNAWYTSMATVFNSLDIIKFYKDASTYVMEKSMSKYSKYVYNKNNIKNLVDYLFKAPEQVAKDFEKYLNEDMNYLGKNIQSLEEDMRKKEMVFGTYKEIKINLEQIYEDLCQFRLLRLQKDKRQILSNKLKFLPSMYDSEGIKPILSGLNRSVFRGQLQLNETTFSYIMLYKNEDGKSWKSLLKEYLKHMEISECFRRNQRMDIMKCFCEIQYHVLFYVEDNANISPTFVVSAIDCTFTNYMDKTRENITSESLNVQQTLYKEICRLLKQMLTGLLFLHSNKMAHYDLTGDSIGYSYSSQSVKLTSISLPAIIKVNYEKSSTEYIKNISHLPWFLLDQDSDHMYTSQSDMYCLGILLYSMWNSIQPFHHLIIKENVETVNDFVNILKKRHYYSIAQSAEFDHGFAHIVFNWSCQCVEGLFTAERFQNNVNVETFYGSMEL